MGPDGHRLFPGEARAIHVADGAAVITNQGRKRGLTLKNTVTPVHGYKKPGSQAKAIRLRWGAKQIPDAPLFSRVEDRLNKTKTPRTPRTGLRCGSLA